MSLHSDGLSRYGGFTDEQWRAMTGRAEYMRAILALPKRQRARLVEEAAQSLGLHKSTIYECVAKFGATERVTDLAPRAVGYPKGLSRLRPEVRAIMDSKIHEVFLKGHKTPLKELVKAITEACEAESLPPPSRSSVKRRISELDQRLVAKKRGELRKAEALAYRPGSLEVTRLNAVWQIDHTLVDLMIVTELERQLLGRPWLTMVIDVASRMVAGFYLSFDPPSALSVARALSMAVFPKDGVLARYGVDAVWPVCGLPETLHTDGASEFARSKAYRRGCDEYVIRIVTRPPGEPHYGGHIERLIGNFMGRAKLLPGATFSNPKERERYDSEKAAVMTLSEVTAWLVREIADYHDTTHRSLGRSPLQAWAAITEEHHFTPRMPVDEATFFRDFLPVTTRAIGRQGVQILAGLEYTAPELKELKAYGQTTLDVRYDPADLSRVFARDRSGTPFTLTIRYPDTPPFTLFELRAEQRRRKALGLDPASGMPLVADILKQRQRLSTRPATDLDRAELRTRERLISHGYEIAGARPNGYRSWTEVLEAGE